MDAHQEPAHLRANATDGLWMDTTRGKPEQSAFGLVSYF